jgi:hypothetical protein
MPAGQYQVGVQNATRNSLVTQRGSFGGEAVVSMANGKYVEAWRSGQAFLYTTPAQALLVAATTGGHPTLWNPLGSGKVAYVGSMAISWLSGTNTAGSILAAVTSNTGGAIGTAAPIVTFTQVAQIGNPGFGSAMRWSPTTNTFTAAPTVVANTGFNLAATQPTGILQQDFDGAIAIYPGQALSLVYSVATSTALLYATILVIEEPYNL